MYLLAEFSAVKRYRDGCDPSVVKSSGKIFLLFILVVFSIDQQLCWCCLLGAKEAHQNLAMKRQMLLHLYRRNHSIDTDCFGAKNFLFDFALCTNCFMYFTNRFFSIGACFTENADMCVFSSQCRGPLLTVYFSTVCLPV